MWLCMTFCLFKKEHTKFRTCNGFCYCLIVWFAVKKKNLWYYMSLTNSSTSCMIKINKQNLKDCWEIKKSISCSIQRSGRENGSCFKSECYPQQRCGFFYSRLMRIYGSFPAFELVTALRTLKQWIQAGTAERKCRKEKRLLQQQVTGKCQTEKGLGMWGRQEASKHVWYKEWSHVFF